MHLSRYLQLNASYANPICFGLTHRGFYSEINNLLNAILFCLVAKRRLYVDPSRFAGGGLTWSDLYSSQLPWETGEIREPVLRIAGNQSPGFKQINHRVSQWHNRRRVFLSRSYGFYGSVFAAQRDLVALFCRPALAAVDPPEAAGPYAAIHVRRGDKVHGYTWQGNLIVEGEDIDLPDYLAVIAEKAPHLRRIFVMTDDYQVVSELRSLDSGLDVFTCCDAEEHGYRQKDFNSLDPLAKTQAIQRLIAEVELACQSDLFIGCYTSNVSRYIAMAHKNPQQCFSVDSLKLWNP